MTKLTILAHEKTAEASLRTVKATLVAPAVSP